MISDIALSEINSDYLEKNIPVFCSNNEMDSRLEMFFNLENMDENYLQCLKIDQENPLVISISSITFCVKIENAGLLESAIRSECLDSLGIKSVSTHEINILGTHTSVGEITTSRGGTERENNLRKLLKNVSRWIENPTHKCVSCFSPMCGDFQGILPIVCNDEKCKFFQSEIGHIDLYSVIHNESEVFDLLWSLFYTSVTHLELKDNEVPNKFIGKKSTIPLIMNLLPPVLVLQSYNKQDLEPMILKMHPELPYLMRWVLGGIRYGLKWTGQFFRIYNENPEKMARYASLSKERQVVSGYHGSNIKNWHTIFRTSLQNMSGTKHQVHGAAHGKGIYLGKTKETSLSYCGQKGIAWEKSRFVGAKLVVEVSIVNYQIKDVSGFCYVVENEDKVVMNKILLCS